MQLITVISAASAMVATVSARSAVDLNKSCDKSQPYVRIVNRCEYPVYLWSVFKGDGCPTDQMVTLKNGDTYSENYQDPENGVGISVKMSKTEKCKTNDILQFEYYLEKTDPAYAYNYLDMSYVDCLDGDCPTKQEGYYLQAGDQIGKFASSADNTWCPILSCSDAASCAKMSYILPDDVQTKTCDLKQNTDVYLCGGEAPTEDYDSPAPASSSEEPVYSAPAPTSSAQETPTENLKVDAAAVTNAPEIKEPAKEQKTKTQVEVVYVTAYEYVNAKRHAHGHARRHQPFHA